MTYEKDCCLRNFGHDEDCPEREKTKPKTEDVVFAGDWVYCGQHLRPHGKGWCTVSNRDKLGLGIEGDGSEQQREAYRKCECLGLRLYHGTESDTVGPGDVFESRDKRQKGRRVKIIGRTADGSWRAARVLAHGTVKKETILSEGTLKSKWRKTR